MVIRSSGGVGFMDFLQWEYRKGERCHSGRGEENLLVFLCAGEAGLVHKLRDGVGFVRVFGYFIYNPHGGE